jgi:hypothetical protein
MTVSWRNAFKQDLPLCFLHPCRPRTPRYGMHLLECLKYLLDVSVRVNRVGMASPECACWHYRVQRVRLGGSSPGFVPCFVHPLMSTILHGVIALRFGSFLCKGVRSCCRSTAQQPRGLTQPPPSSSDQAQLKSVEVDATAETSAAGRATACHTCGEVFTTLHEQRDHFKLDWHRLNIKRSVAGLHPLSEDACERLLADDASSLSGSGAILTACPRCCF